MKNRVRVGLNPLSWLGIALALAPALAGAQLQPLDFPGATATRAMDINDLGQVVGFYYEASGVSHGFLYESWNGDAATAYTTVDYPGADWSQARAINRDGDIVGFYGYNTEQFFHGFLRTAGGNFSSIDHRRGRWNTMPEGINASGVIAGCAHNPGTMFGWVMQNGRFGSETRGEGWTGYAMYTGINDDGTLVGWYWSGNRVRSFVLNEAGRSDFRYPGGGDNTQAWGVNSFGDVVGWYGPPGFGRGFLLRNGQFSQIHVADAIWTAAYGINAVGDIVGAYGDANGTHGFLWPGFEPPEE